MRAAASARAHNVAPRDGAAAIGGLSAVLPTQANQGSDRRRGTAGLAETGARRGRSDHARDRRGHRRRHLRRHRHGRGRADRPERGDHPDRRGAGPRVLVPAAGRRLCPGRVVLRGAGRDDSAGRQRLRLLLRDARRTGRVDHRLGPDSRVRRRQRRRGHLLGRLLHHASPRLRPRAPGVDDDGLPDRAAQFRPGHPRPAADRSDDCRHPRPGERAGVRRRDGDHLAAAARGAREHDRQQHHGGHQAGRAGVVCRRRRVPHQVGELPPVRAERLHGDSPGRRDRLLRLHRLRRDLDRGRGNEEPAAQSARSGYWAGWPSAP